MIPELVQRAREFLHARRIAYVATFSTPMSTDVLKDLAKFCRAHKSTAHTDPYLAARLDGRREVWLRIQSHLQLSDDDLWKLHNPER